MRLSEAHYTHSAYERRKRACTIALLAREHYESAFEPGCGYGHLTELLARRCTRLLATDADAATVERARQRLAHHRGVAIEHTCVPTQWPREKFDLIVLAEFLYYLPKVSIATLAACAAQSLEAGGEIIACHWRHPIPESDFSGDAAHEILEHWLGLERTDEHADRDFVLASWRRPLLSSGYGPPRPPVAANTCPVT